MKVIPLLVFMFLIASMVARAQMGFFGGGANLSLAKSDALDFIVQRYNETRTDCNIFCLSGQMEDFRNISGMCFGLGWVTGGGMAFDFTWSGRNDVVHAEGTPPGFSEQQRDVKLRANSFDLGIGYTSPEGTVRPGILVSTDLGAVKTFTRAGDKTNISSVEYENTMDDLSLGFTLSGNLYFVFGDGGIGFMLRPYYQFAVFDTDFYDLNAAINSATYINDDLESQIGRLSNYGLKIMLIAGGWSG